MKNTISILFLLLLPFLFSCEKDANIPVPESEPKLVLYGFFSPDDDTLELKVTWTKPVFGKESINENVTGAEVRLEGPSGSITFPEYGLGLYVQSKELANLQYNTSYTLFVKAPNGKEARASFSIPPPADNIGFSASIIDSIMSDYGNGPVADRYTFKVNVSDADPALKYLRITNFAFTDFGFGGDYTWNPMDYDLNQRLFRSEGPNPRNYEFFFASYPGNSFDPSASSSYRFTLIRAGQDYFDFHNRLYNYEDDNPFGEPTLLYSNVTGGLGIVAGYAKKEILITR
jgi:hypothetical protein